MVRKEIHVLLTVERVAISEAHQMQTVCHLPPGLSEGLIMAVKYH
jgi:hypothetical protein